MCRVETCITGANRNSSGSVQPIMTRNVLSTSMCVHSLRIQPVVAVPLGSLVNDI